MIPLTLACIIGGCLDVPVDTRPLHRQIYEDQIRGRQTVRAACYVGETFYKVCPPNPDFLGLGDWGEED